ncbi:MAG: hypothetical protein VX949_08285 [Planctomycetota bacterium]|nr:hypothetical protein [Planctomycetota bacterium]
MVPTGRTDRQFGGAVRAGLAALILALLSGAVMLQSGCGQAPVRSGSQVASGPPVLRAEGAIHRTGPGETLHWIASDRGFHRIELEALNPQWKSVTIPPGTLIRLPIGKPKIRRIRNLQGGTR